MRLRGARRAGVLALVATALLVLVTMASAQAQSDSFLLLRTVDATDPANTRIQFVWTGSDGDLGGASLTQNGESKPFSTSPRPVEGPRAMVFVVDTSQQMDDGNSLISVRDGAKAAIDESPEGTQFAVVQAGAEADLKLDLTTNKQVAKSAIDGLGPTDGAQVWSSLQIAGELLKAAPQVQPNIVLAVASNSLGATEEPVGRTAVLTSGATMWTIEKTGAMRTGPYDDLTSTAGGQVFTTDDATQMGELVRTSGNQITTKQFEAVYDAGLSDDQVADVTLTVGGSSSSGTFLVGSEYQGQELRPEIADSGLGLPLLDNKLVLAVALILILVAVAAAAYAITSLFVRDDLSDVLQPYADPYGDLDDEDDEGNALQKSAIVKRAVELTEQVAENQGFLTRTEAALERANLPLRAGEALAFYVVIVIVVTLVGLLFTRNLLGGIVVGVLGALIPVSVVNYLARKRRKTFMGQLPDTLQLLAGTLRAGYSLMQGVEAVSQEVTDPMGIELRRVVTEARLGRPLEESLEASAERMDSPDFAWAVMAIRIQREVGGNLSELLMTVADTMVQRERLRRDVASLTAEGRMSALVLGCLPLGLGIIMYILNPKYVGVLFTDPVGIGMLITAIVSMVIGFLWMRKIINIEI